MVPSLVHDIGSWIDQFSDALTGWETLLCQLREAYLQGDQEKIVLLCLEGEGMQRAIANGKQARLELLQRARDAGWVAANLKELSVQLDTLWPALWTLRIRSMESQLVRIEQLSVSLWITAFQARDFVTELIRILSTGRSEHATYSPSESHTHEGGFLVNEAA
jgi:hypothetical protein